jgi:DmsE family decaheme c-type cytochrome
MAKMPNHHPLDEGAVKCSDCHDLHRSKPAVFAGKRWTETCARCHRTEATPRLYPHEADRADGCIACHEPHGSPAPRLLRFPRVADLCLSCHIPPATHDLSPSSAFRSCLACHGEIHGSDVHPKLLR